jgi:hypothetical protein
VSSRRKAPSRPGGKRGSQEAEALSRQRALFALPLGDFTSARNALAQELKSKGQTKLAQATKQLKRPVVTAWVVNQLAHRSPEKIEALLAAARTLESAHRRVLSGLGPEALKEANRAFQQTLDALMAEAHKLLATEGRAVTSELFRQVEETLRAAALGTEEDRTTLSQGMLTQPLQQAGLGAFSPLTLIGPSSRARPERRVQEKPSHRRATRPPLQAVPPPPPSRGAVVLRGPWTPRHEEEAKVPPTPAAPSKRQREEELHQRQLEARLKRTAELQQRRREVKQQAERAERAQRSTSLEVARAQSALKAAEVKTLRMRQAFEQAEEAERERAEAVARVREQAEASEQALEQARRELRELDESLAELT